MRRLRGASLLEAVVAAVLMLTIFAAAMELLPHLTVSDEDTLSVAEAEYRVARTFDKYATGLWPCGEYAEAYDRGRIVVAVEPYRDLPDMQAVTLTAHIDGSRKRIALKRLIECKE